jgi:hypothetical protein
VTLKIKRREWVRDSSATMTRNRWQFYHDLFDATDREVNDETMHKHHLLEILSMLDIISYEKEYDGCWEIRI